LKSQGLSPGAEAVDPSQPVSWEYCRTLDSPLCLFDAAKGAKRATVGNGDKMRRATIILVSQNETYAA
jgi:hypothetical protein